MSDAQTAQREAMLREVGETILSIEAAERRCRRALAAVDTDVEANVRLALERTADALGEVRRGLQQGTYLAADQQRLL